MIMIPEFRFATFVVVHAFRTILVVLGHVFDPREAYRFAIKAFKEAKSGTFADDWTHILESDRYGYVRVWEGLEFGAECAQANDLCDRKVVCETAAEFSETLNSIPDQQDGSRRVYVVEVYDDHALLPWENNSDGTDDFVGNNRSSNGDDNEDIDGNNDRDSRRTDDRNAVSSEDSHTRSSTSEPYYSYTSSTFSVTEYHYKTGIMSLLSRNNGPTVWYRLESFEILLKPRPRTSRQDVSFARVERSMLFQGDQNHSKVWIQCKTFEPDKPNFVWGLPRVPFQVTSSFANQLYDLDRMYQTFKNASNWKQLFSLQYYHATLISYSEFIVAYEEWYIKQKQPLFDPRCSEFKQGHLKEITKQSCRIQDIKRAGERLMEAVEYLTEIAKDVVANKPGSSATSASPTALNEASFTGVQQEIRGHCIEIKGCLVRLSNGLEHDIKFLGLRREMRQTNSVQRLTILATIFLPLSLSAGILSMQTRFKNLGPLLYDFLGVVILLGALVVSLMVFLSFLKIATDHVLVDVDLQLGATYKEIRSFLSGLMWFGITTFATLVLVSFTLGMFKDVGLGARVLGYGTAVFSFPLVSMIVFVWSYVFLRWLWKLRKSRKQSQRQTETYEEGRDEEAAQSPGAVAETITTVIELTDTPRTGQRGENAPTSQAVSS